MMASVSEDLSWDCSANNKYFQLILDPSKDKLLGGGEGGGTGS